MSWKYEDIVNLDRPSMGLRPRMSLESRAIQFGSFSALNGHSQAIQDASADFPDTISDCPDNLV